MSADTLLKFIWQTGRFPAPEGFQLPRRPNKRVVEVSANPDAHTVEQLLIAATMKKYDLSFEETAQILGISEYTLRQYMLRPELKNFRRMSPNLPALLDSWCQLNKKPGK